MSVGDSIRLLQLGAAVGRDVMAVGVEYQGGLGGIGIGKAVEGLGNIPLGEAVEDVGNPMVISVVKYLVGVQEGT